MKDFFKTIFGLVSFFLTALSVFEAVKKKDEIQKTLDNK